MRLKKIFSVMLCAALTLGLFTGCGNSNSGDGVSNGEEQLIFTVNGHDVYEKDFKYIANQYKNELETYYGPVSDWSAELESGITYGDYVISMAKNWFMYAEAVKSQAIRLGVTLTDEDQQTLEEQWQTTCEENGGEEELLAAIEENGLTKEFNDYITEVSFTADKCFTKMYGQNGELVSDEDCAEKTSEDGYVMAKHILILTTTTDDEGNSVEFTDDEKAAAKERAENLLKLLNACSADELGTKFDELAENNSDDTGLLSNPDGYLFKEGDVETEFYQAASALEVGAYSDIVETDSGYHIIMRVPVSYDTIPMAYASYGDSGYDYYTLRYIVANSMFSANIDSWIQRVELTNTEIIDSLDMETIIAVG